MCSIGVDEEARVRAIWFATIESGSFELNAQDAFSGPDD
jgi:hypothetical protein